MIPKLIWRWQTSSSALTKLCALEVQKMFCVERSDGPDIWFKEQCFESEFKAFTNARAKSLDTFKLYRVVYESPDLQAMCGGFQKGERSWLKVTDSLDKYWCLNSRNSLV